jgi:hypothetical protein
MELDFSKEWRIIGPREAEPGGPADFAAAELAAVLGRMGCRPPAPGDEGLAERIIVLSAGRGDVAASSGSEGGAGRFSWRASVDRVEIYGKDGAALLRGVYDFLGALGARWPGPGEGGERLPSGPILDLSPSSRASSDEAVPTTLILGHGAFLERYAEYLPWAARLGYRSIFVHTTPDRLAMGAAPAALYESLRDDLAPLARSLGLSLELGGHGLSALLPRSLFKTESALFRERGGERVADRNFCPSSAKALALVSDAFAAYAEAHSEIEVFHAWPDDLSGGGWCSCPSCASLSPAAQSLAVARELASALARVRPDAALSFLAYHDTEDVADSIRRGIDLPPKLELLWAPRRRSWGSDAGGAKSSLNAASIAAFRKTAQAWRAAGGGRVVVFEYYEDALLFKGAVPPLAAVIEGDLAAYRGCADAIGLLCTGGRLPLAPRPNAALLPVLAASPNARADASLADWTAAAYGPAAVPMLEYWRELEAAWAVDLDIEEGETAAYMPESLAHSAVDPPADWGDPWKAGVDRLAAKRGRCEELFDHLRRAEEKLAEAKGFGEMMEESKTARAVRGEAAEYAISGSVLELNCARLSAYHELAAGDPRAAADIANLALSASSAVRRSFARLPDPRSRREMNLMIDVYYDLRLRMIRRANARSGLRRLVDLWLATARASLAALTVSRAYEPSAPIAKGRGLARPMPKH